MSLIRFLTQARRAAVPFGIILALVPAAAGADAARAFGDWVLIPAPGACQLMTHVTSQTTGDVVLEMILVAPEGGAPGARVGLRVPTGASLRDGIAFRHPGGPAIGLEWQSCDASMCLAAGALSEAALRDILRGNRLIAGFRPLPGARLVNIEISLRGTTAGWTALQSCG